MLHNNSYGYFTEIATSFTSEDGMWRRALRNGTQTGWYKMLDSGNYNSYAPKLDGTGASGTWGINISGNAATADTLAKTFAENINYAAYSTGLKLIRYDDNWDANGLPRKWTSGLSVMAGYCGWQLVTYGGQDDFAYFRKVSDKGVWSNWRILAFTDSNVASATKLANSRTIWGQSFDGTGNVSGALSGVTTINSTLYIDLLGNIGIGAASPSYKLYVNGDGYFVDNVITESDFSSRGDAIIDGTVSCYKLSQASDIKYKTNIKQIEYEEALKIIENLNPVTWDWNENTIVTGSSSGFVAQEAEEFIPNAISRDNKNNLSLDYTQLHSYEIKVIQEQQKEIIKLKEKLKILEKLIS